MVAAAGSCESCEVSVNDTAEGENVLRREGPKGWSGNAMRLWLDSGYDTCPDFELCQGVKVLRSVTVS